MSSEYWFIVSAECYPLLSCLKKLKMIDFIKKHKSNLPAVLLILMLVVPFLLYYFARSGSNSGVMVALVIMGAVMLTAMKK